MTWTYANVLWTMTNLLWYVKNQIIRGDPKISLIQYFINSATVILKNKVSVSPFPHVPIITKRPTRTNIIIKIKPIEFLKSPKVISSRQLRILHAHRIPSSRCRVDE